MNHIDTEALDGLRIALDPMGQAGVALALMLVMFGVAWRISFFMVHRSFFNGVSIYFRFPGYG